MNEDIRSLSKWLNANKVFVNVTKAKVLIFKRKSRVFDTDLKLKLCGKKLFTGKTLKYLESLWMSTYNGISTLLEVD